jgi:hypothetical protein
MKIGFLCANLNQRSRHNAAMCVITQGRLVWKKQKLALPLGARWQAALRAIWNRRVKETAQEFCDHGATILAGLVGQPQGDQNFF